jgi:putative colanic acid biosynthesis acetyltransferase WcaF
MSKDDFERLRYVDNLSHRNKLARLLWEVVWLLFFRPTPRWTLHAWRRCLLRCFGAKVGRGSLVAPDCFVWAPWHLEIGDYSVLSSGVDCYCVNKIRIGSKVAVSQRSFLCTASHDTRSLKRPLITKPIDIGNHVWIAAEAMVLPGVTIAEGAVIGARSVVSSDMPAWMICVGNPCRAVKRRGLDAGEMPDVPSQTLPGSRTS